MLRALGSDGPVTPHQLMELTGLDRSGVHRAVAALISEGFARYQLGHRQIVLTDAALQDFRAARSAPEDVERASEAIRTVIRGKRIHADIATLAGPGRLAVVESTEPESAALEYQGFFEADLAAVLLSAIPPEEAVRHIAAASASSGDLRDLRNEFVHRVREAGERSSLWNVADRELCVPLHTSSGSDLAIRLRPGSGGARDSRFFVALIGEMARIEPELFPHLL